MISIGTALQLQAAGLEWIPVVNDFFAIPDRDMDDRVFVISDIQASIDKILGQPVIAFQGASEWALDNLQTRDVVWLPSEEQLRKILEAALLRKGEYRVDLICDLKGCQCIAKLNDRRYLFFSKDASEAYAAALLQFLTETDS